MVTRMACGLVLVAAWCASAAVATADAEGIEQPTVIDVFVDQGLQFGGDAGWRLQEAVEVGDNGRWVQREITLPPIPEGSLITTRLTLEAGEDPWDRAGTVTLETPDGPVELHKFITGFSGTQSHSQDVSHLRPLLSGRTVTIRGFLDTWVEEARTIDFALYIQPPGTPQVDAVPEARWVKPLFFEGGWNAESHPDHTITRAVDLSDVPESERVHLYVLASGHCTDGRGADEFVRRTHTVRVDGEPQAQWVPWRTDGWAFRASNPTSGRWDHPTGQQWSSDLHRAGWMPGDDVTPRVFDLTEALTDGSPHEIAYQIEQIRPNNEKGDHGYWRCSAYLVGF